MEKALNLLLAGIVIVFFVLVLLIVIIKIYSAIVQAAQNGSKNKKGAKKPAEKKTEPVKVNAQAQISTVEPINDGAIPGEIIAVIAAAVDSMYGEKPVKIKSVKRSRANSGSSWRNAGLFENTKPF